MWLNRETYGTNVGTNFGKDKNVISSYVSRLLRIQTRYNSTNLQLVNYVHTWLASLEVSAVCPKTQTNGQVWKDWTLRQHFHTSLMLTFIYKIITKDNLCEHQWQYPSKYLFRIFFTLQNSHLLENIVINFKFISKRAVHVHRSRAIGTKKNRQCKLNLKNLWLRYKIMHTWTISPIWKG